MNTQIRRSVSDCEIIEQAEIAPHVFRSVLVERTIAQESRPGQFVNVRACECLDPLLRRPFSVHGVSPEEGTFSLLYNVVGRGTKLFAGMKVGDKVSVVGPLGSSFETGTDPGATHILVAGGLGAAPIRFLSEVICRAFGCHRVTVLAGARTASALLCERELVAQGVQVQIATEDGSLGMKGLVTDLLSRRLSQLGRDASGRVYSCGPMPMMREVARICRENRIESCQLSLETAMACGVGVCMGCVVKTCEEHDQTCEDWRYSRVCAEGPVFEAKELVWE